MGVMWRPVLPASHTRNMARYIRDIKDLSTNHNNKYGFSKTTSGAEFNDISKLIQDEDDEACEKVKKPGKEASRYDNAYTRMKDDDCKEEVVTKNDSTSVKLRHGKEAIEKHFTTVLNSLLLKDKPEKENITKIKEPEVNQRKLNTMVDGCDDDSTNTKKKKDNLSLPVERQAIGMCRGESIFQDMPENIYDDMPVDIYQELPENDYLDVSPDTFKNIPVNVFQDIGGDI